MKKITEQATAPVQRPDHRPPLPPASAIRRDSISTNEAFRFWFPEGGKS